MSMLPTEVTVDDSHASKPGTGLTLLAEGESSRRRAMRPPAVTPAVVARHE
jgi:hypothetical protein